jgi:hypothetical protein
MLEAAARHSLTLGYRWNPLKCAVLNYPIGRTDSRVPSKVIGRVDTVFRGKCCYTSYIIVHHA